MKKALHCKCPNRGRESAMSLIKFELIPIRAGLILELGHDGKSAGCGSNKAAARCF